MLGRPETWQAKATRLTAVAVCTALAGLAPCPASSAPARTTRATEWKTFVSRGGWSIDYPRGWTVSSCNNCRDPAEPGIFVGFSGARDDDFVMVSPLADRPVTQTVAQWLNDVAVTANLNTVLEKHPSVLNGHFAMVVRYRYADGTIGDETFVVDGVRTFQIGGLISIGSPALPVVRHMVATFRTRPVARRP